MLKTNPYAAYKEVQVKSATRENLVIMAYDGTIKFLNRALEAFENENQEEINSNILRTQAIISEMMVSLNFEEGKEIATNLFRIYEYMNYRLTYANIKKEPEPLHEIIALLITLREGWLVAREKVSTHGKAAGVAK
jgi:flagellar secretion chaperone FliS